MVVAVVAVACGRGWVGVSVGWPGEGDGKEVNTGVGGTKSGGDCVFLLWLVSPPQGRMVREKKEEEEEEEEAEGSPTAHYCPVPTLRPRSIPPLG